MANETVMERNLEIVLQTVFELLLKNGKLIAGIEPIVEAFVIRKSLFGFLTSIILSLDMKTASDCSIVEQYIDRLLMPYVT